jgi:hypothetical protein
VDVSVAPHDYIWLEANLELAVSTALQQYKFYHKLAVSAASQQYKFSLVAVKCMAANASL